jgi:TatD DNase family protein
MKVGNMRFIDTHCHYDDPEFDPDRAALTQAAQVLGVTDLVLPAISAATWGRLKALCDSSPQFHASYGLHPIYLAEHQPKHLQQLREWLVKERPVAVGECGLDFYLPTLNVQQQTDLFVAQLKLAREFDLPVMVHARRSLDAVLQQLRKFPGSSGVIHSFAGSLQQAETLIKFGFYLGVGGTCTYERANKLRNILKIIPLETLVLETDAPDQPDSQWRGKRNDPTRLPVIAQALADLRQSDLTTIAAATTANARRLFNGV